MATSGSVDFSISRNEIIEAALRLVGSKRRGVTLEAEEINNASEALNMMVKAWQAQGLHLWKIKELTVFLQKSSQNYSLGSGNVTASYVQTTIASAASSGASTITVADDTGISDNDFIGIELDSGSIQWTAVNGAPASDVITLDATTTGAAAVGNYVFAYTTKAPRPLRVLDGRVKRSDGDEIPIEKVSRQEYFALPNKNSTGQVNQMYYDPQLSSGVLYVWPTTDSVKTVLNITVYSPIEDFDDEDDTPDFPQEWYEAMKFGLASRIGLEKGLEINRQMLLDAKADRALADVLSWDDGEESVYLQPDTM